ncbi:hypothetical protein Tco_1323562 [Tanacetum coccineum]
MYLYVCPAVGFTCADTMADMNVPANDAPTEQAPTIVPPIRTNDQILPFYATGVAWRQEGLTASLRIPAYFTSAVLGPMRAHTSVNTGACRLSINNSDDEMSKQTMPSAPKATKVTKTADDKAPKPTSSQPPKPKPAPTKPSKAVPEMK